MYHIADIKSVHLELTTKCSARCPQCSRNWHGETAPWVPQVELSLKDIEHIFPPSLLKSLEFLFVCGNYGDVTAARDTIEIIRYFKATKPGIKLQIHSHGSARPIDWWREMAYHNVVCHFGIDGLEDTNHIYRKRTNWKMIMRNAEAFIDAGGRAVWDFIVFAHNEHQVEEAKKLSEDMKFIKFMVKRTGRFSIYAQDGTNLAAPRNEEFRNRAIERIKNECGENGSAGFKQYLETTEIDCKAIHKRQIYVTADGMVFPCCWLGHIYPRPSSKTFSPLELLEKVPDWRSSICAFHHPISEIIEGPFFQEIIPAGWETGGNRTRICAKKCGLYNRHDRDHQLWKSSSPQSKSLIGDY